MKAVFLRAIEADDKATAVLAVIRDRTQSGGGRYEVDPAAFSAIATSPFSYWIGESVLRVFQRAHSTMEVGRQAKNGLGTLADFRFVRLAYEVPVVQVQSPWVPFTKGGRRAGYYQDVVCRVNWNVDGRELKANVEYTYGGGHWSRNIRSVDFYFRPGLTWPLRGVVFSAQAVPEGCIFSVGGKMLFAESENLFLLLAVLNSAPFDLLVRIFAGKVGGVQYQSGMIEGIPVPLPDPFGQTALADLARRAWSLKRSLDTRTETSHAFVLPAILQVEGVTLADRAAAWLAQERDAGVELATIEAEIDERCFELYGIDDEDRRAITEGFGGSAGGSEVSEDDAEDVDTEDETEAEATADTTTLAAELVSWAVGVAVGRFDVRLTTGARRLPDEPEPFDPLPVCSPAMLTGDDGLPLARPPAGYPLSFPEDGILVDDPGHPRDLKAAVRAVVETVFGARADSLWQETVALLGPRDHDLRRWLASGFFEHHLRHHSKSRRKAPIIWQLGIPSGRYSVWCYAHRLTRDSLFAIQNDVVAPKLAHEERRRSSLVSQAGPTPSVRDRAEIDAQEAVVDELRILAEEVRRVAPLWNPDLDDGIVLVMAPLWRLVPGHKAWQKELKGRWDDLAAGKYDWAHLAMHLWPERVVPKCATDRSLAIAHSLEDVFWVEGADGKWTRRGAPTRSVDDLVAERTSPAVKAALVDLLGAPAPAGGGGRRGRSARVPT